MYKIPNFFAKELNSKRIKAYQDLANGYNVEEGTVRDIFQEGIKFAIKEILKANKHSSVSNIKQ